MWNMLRGMLRLPSQPSQAKPSQAKPSQAKPSQTETHSILPL